MFYAVDYPVIKQNEIAQLIRDAGFVPFDAGPLHEGKKQEPGTSRYSNELTLEEAQRLDGASGQSRSTSGEIDTGARAQPAS
jgi:hypothetical protein